MRKATTQNNLEDLWFQQNEATTLTLHVFCVLGRMALRNAVLWPPRLPDLSSCNFLVDLPGRKVFKPYLRTLKKEKFLWHVSETHGKLPRIFIERHGHHFVVIIFKVEKLLYLDLTTKKQKKNWEKEKKNYGRIFRKDHRMAKEWKRKKKQCSNMVLKKILIFFFWQNDSNNKKIMFEYRPLDSGKLNIA